jgi:hypothetical protein
MIKTMKPKQIQGGRKNNKAFEFQKKKTSKLNQFDSRRGIGGIALGTAFFPPEIKRARTNAKGQKK